MQSNDSHDEKVEIVDLDTPNSSWQRHILHTTHRLFAKTPARGKIIMLALLCSIVILFTMLQASLHFMPLGTARPTPTAVAIPLETSLTMFAANGTAYIVGSDGSLSAYRALDGVRRWQIKATQGTYSSPVASDRAVYVNLVLGKEGRIEARKASSGASLWMSQSLPSGIWRLVVQDSIVYASTQDGILYAFDAATGKVLWHFASGQSMPDIYFGVEKDIAIIPTKDATIYVLQARSGKVLWHFHPDPHGSLWYQVDNGIFYYASDGKPLQAFSLSTGKLLWQYTQAVNDIGSFIAYKGVVYINIRDGGMTALQERDGKFLWHNSAIAALSLINLPIDNNTLYVSADYDDTLVGLRASDGKQLWRHKIDGLSYYAHWIDPRNDALYLLQKDNSPSRAERDSVQGRNISTGKLLWRYVLPSPITGPFTVVDGILYVQCTSGTLDVVRLSDGKLLWHL